MSAPSRNGVAEDTPSAPVPAPASSPGPAVPTPGPGPGPGGEPWAVALFHRSVLKQRKLAELERALGAPGDRRCLDLGSDNGVVSLMLRRAGGRWASADLTGESVAAIRELVGDDVHRVDLSGARLPFADAEFDAVVVVDMLEHVEDEAGFAAELARVTRPGGRLVVNTPHLKRTALRRLRHALGQTDEKHGHLRPGYTPDRLRELFGDRFRLESSRTYSRFFSELVDTAINLAVERLGKKGSRKGMVVTGGDVSKHRKLFRAYSLVYPGVWLLSRLDLLLPWTTGYMLIATAVRTPTPPQPGPVGARAPESPDQPPSQPTSPPEPRIPSGALRAGGATPHSPFAEEKSVRGARRHAARRAPHRSPLPPQPEALRARHRFDSQVWRGARICGRLHGSRKINRWSSRERASRFLPTRRKRPTPCRSKPGVAWAGADALRRSSG